MKDSNYDLIDIKNAFRLIAGEEDTYIPVSELEELFRRQGVEKEKIQEIIEILSAYIENGQLFNYKLFVSHLCWMIVIIKCWMILIIRRACTYQHFRISQSWGPFSSLKNLEYKVIQPSLSLRCLSLLISLELRIRFSPWYSLARNGLFSRVFQQKLSFFPFRKCRTSNRLPFALWSSAFARFLNSNVMLIEPTKALLGSPSLSYRSFTLGA